MSNELKVNIKTNIQLNLNIYMYKIIKSKLKHYDIK